MTLGPDRSYNSKNQALAEVRRLRSLGYTVKYHKVPGGPWIVYTTGKKNPAAKLGSRLTPVKFSVNGKRATGKAKRVNGKIKIFVTPRVARRINPGYFAKSPIPDKAFSSKAQAKDYAQSVRDSGYTARIVRLPGGTYLVTPGKGKR